MQEVGVRYSFKTTGSFTVPYDLPQERIPLAAYIGKFADKLARRDNPARLERVLKVEEAVIPIFTDGGSRREYLIHAIVSSVAVNQTFDVEEKTLKVLFDRYPEKFNERQLGRK